MKRTSKTRQTRKKINQINLLPMRLLRRASRVLTRSLQIAKRPLQTAPLVLVQLQPEPSHTLNSSMRTHFCASILESDIGSEVQVCGWVNSRRDHGGVIFIDLRDSSGIVQVVVNPEQTESFLHAESVRNEFVLQVCGTLRMRPDGTENPSLPTGKIEVVADSIVILNKAENLPFQVDEVDANEALRLKYRYIDLRREKMQRNIRLRHSLIREIRSFLDQRSFTEIETPMLTRSTPEGARDYLVPSRVHTGSFYALPQSPQMFKQMLVISGFERYYQIARCFRDEDLRSDRQPEFTQLDVEMAFISESDVMNLMEEMYIRIFDSVGKITLPAKFPVLTYSESMLRYGTDRPDLRINLELVDLTDLMASEEFQVFQRAANMQGGRVAALNVPDGSVLSRQQIDEYTRYVGEFGAKGLAYIKVNDPSQGTEGLQSPILKFLSDATVAQTVKQCASQAGDIIFFGADAESVVNAALGALRIRIAEDLGLIEPGWQPIWIVDFPLVEFDSDNQRWHSLHHPFTAPKEEHVDLLGEDPGAILSRAYDLVLNGVEIGGGSIRNHRLDIQRRIFEVLGLSQESIEAKFGFLLNALTSGAPPHGGIAFGLDRISALLSGESSIRDVIAFPKTQRAYCPVTDAPNEISSEQLNELELRIKSTAAIMSQVPGKGG